MKKIIMFLFVCVFCLAIVFAQEINSAENTKTTIEKEELVEYIKKIMQDEKVSDDIAKKIAEIITENKEEKISEDVKTFEQEVREFYIDPPVSQFGLGIFFGSVFNGSITSESSFPLPIINLGLGLSYTKSDINHKFGFRWNFNIGGSLLILPMLHLGTDFNWIFLKLRFDSSHTRTTHILDFMLGLGLNADLCFVYRAYLLDPFLQLGMSFSFYNHWTVFAVGGVGYNYVISTDPSLSGSYYAFAKIGIRYNF